MYRRVQAFTFAELLTVLAIFLVLAGLLFPVFQSAKASAKKANCLSNFRQTHAGTVLYISDYDDTFMPVNHRPGSPPDALLDRTWVQLVLPYVRAFEVFACPADSSDREGTETSFDEDLVPGDIYAKYYLASMRVNTGYNYLYLAPVVYRGNRWVSEPKTAGSVAEPSNTLLFIDSIWDRSVSGVPVGGGNWLVVPPCRYKGSEPANRIDSFAGGQVFAPWQGWDVNNPVSPHRYGNAWPWHMGRVNVARVDGSVSSLAMAQLTAGCNVGSRWAGSIHDSREYLWDID